MSKYHIHNTLVQNLKQGLKANPMSQGELARRSGVPQGNISAMLNKGKPATEATWQKLFDVVFPE
jgi:predicted XRE-type DNA-binding protein